MDEKDLKEYEISALFKAENDVPSFLGLLRQHGAEITMESPLRRLALAYPIKKETQAEFGCFHFRAKPDAIAQISKDLETSSIVLRSLIITPPFVKAKPQPLTPRVKTGEPETKTEIIDRPLQKKPALPLSNEALEKKIEEILQ